MCSFVVLEIELLLLVLILWLSMANEFESSFIGFFIVLFVDEVEISNFDSIIIFWLLFFLI